MSARAKAQPGRLCIFARAPELGLVKTRLAATMGAREALHAHRTLVEVCLDQLAAVRKLQAQLWIAGPLSHEVVTGWATAWGIPLRAQQGADLGARMANAMVRSLASAPLAIVVGTDCPTLCADYVEQARTALEHSDLVLGPAEDGGYGLIGLRRPIPELFNRMPWGSAAVTAETLARAEQLKLDVHVLDALWDVDTEADWQRFLELDR